MAGDERRRVHKPTTFLGRDFEAFHAVEDPVNASRIAHETAAALLERVRAYPDPAVVARLVAYTDEHGIDTIAELWAGAVIRARTRMRLTASCGWSGHSYM